MASNLMKLSMLGKNWQINEENKKIKLNYLKEALKIYT